MAQALAAVGGKIAHKRGIVEEVIDFVWEHGNTSLFTNDEMDTRLDVVFSSVARAIERNDRDLVGWFADRLTTVSARLLRNKRVEPSVYFAVYVRALGDITHALSENNGALQSAHAQVLRHKALLPLVSALHASPTTLTARELAERLAMSPSNLSPVLKAAEDVGLVSCDLVGRSKYCSVTRLGQAYMDVVARPLRHRVSTRAIADYWMNVSQAPDSDNAQDQAVSATMDAYPALTTGTIKGLCELATKADGELYRACRLREQLSEEQSWVLVFHSRSAMKDVLGRIVSAQQMKCDVVRLTDEYVEFKPAGARRANAEFTVPYRLFMEESVLLRKSASGEELPVEAASLREIREVAESDAVECFV